MLCNANIQRKDKSNRFSVVNYQLHLSLMSFSCFANQKSFLNNVLFISVQSQSTPKHSPRH